MGTKKWTKHVERMDQKVDQKCFWPLNGYSIVFCCRTVVRKIVYVGPVCSFGPTASADGVDRHGPKTLDGNGPKPLDQKCCTKTVGPKRVSTQPYLLLAPTISIIVECSGVRVRVLKKCLIFWSTIGS